MNLTFKGNWAKYPDRQASVIAHATKAYQALEQKGYQRLGIPVVVFPNYRLPGSGGIGRCMGQDSYVKYAGLQNQWKPQRVLHHEFGHHLFNSLPLYCKRKWLDWCLNQLKPLKPELDKIPTLLLNPKSTLRDNLGRVPFPMRISLATNLLQKHNALNLYHAPWRELWDYVEHNTSYFPHAFTYMCWDDLRSNQTNVQEVFAEAFAIHMGNADPQHSDCPMPTDLAKQFYPMLRYARKGSRPTTIDT